MGGVRRAGGEEDGQGRCASSSIATSTWRSRASGIRSTRASTSVTTTTGDSTAARSRARVRRRLGARPLGVDHRPRPLPPRQRLLRAGVRLLRPRREDERGLAHGVPRLRRPAGHGRDRGDPRPRRPPPRPLARGGPREEPLSRRRARRTRRTTVSRSTTSASRRIWSRAARDARGSPSAAARSTRSTPRAAHASKRGLAITPVKFGISFTATLLNQAGALVLVYRDGTVQVNHGGTEMGQGLYTKMRGVAMRELGVPADAVRVMRTQHGQGARTRRRPRPRAAPISTAQAVRAACETIRERLAPVAAELLSAKSPSPVPGSAVVFERRDRAGAAASRRRGPVRRGRRARVHEAGAALGARASTERRASATTASKGRGKPFYYFAYGAAVTEVEVDGYTGMKRVSRVDILHDVGDSLNPGIDRGQIEGGVRARHGLAHRRGASLGARTASS